MPKFFLMKINSRKMHVIKALVLFLFSLFARLLVFFCSMLSSNFFFLFLIFHPTDHKFFFKMRQKNHFNEKQIYICVSFTLFWYFFLFFLGIRRSFSALNWNVGRKKEKKTTRIWNKRWKKCKLLRSFLLSFPFFHWLSSVLKPFVTLRFSLIYSEQRTIDMMETLYFLNLHFYCINIHCVLWCECRIRYWCKYFKYLKNLCVTTKQWIIIMYQIIAINICFYYYFVTLPFYRLKIKRKWCTI